LPLPFDSAEANGEGNGGTGAFANNNSGWSCSPE